MTKELIAKVQVVKGAHTHALLAKRNVVACGVGYKVSQGRTTDELSVVVSVTRKVAPHELAPADLVPKLIEGVKTDVVETGVIRAFQGPRDRWRPVVPPGVSVGHYRITAGTFGCLVRRGADRFILSNNHVLADANKAEVGDAILQPGLADGGTMEDRIATLADYVPIDFGTAEPDCPIAGLSAKLLNFVAGAFGSAHRLEAVKQTPGVNRVDAALARPLSVDSVSSEILDIGTPVGVETAELGTRVQKSGRTTGHTHGLITQVDVTVKVDYNGPVATFIGQLMAGAMSQPGDSGSAVLDEEKQVVGLLFAGSDVATVINPIDAVLEALNIKIVT